MSKLGFKSENDLRRDFVARLPYLKDEAARLNLFKTMHALKESERIAGCELAEILVQTRAVPPAKPGGDDASQ